MSNNSRPPPGRKPVSTAPPVSRPTRTIPPASRRGSSPAPPDTARPPTLRPPPASKPEVDLPVDVPPVRNSLDEVERALSVLDGRHHDTVRVQRETQKSIAAKRAIAELAERRALSSQKRGAQLRILLAGAVVAALASGAWFGRARYQASVAADASLTSLAAPYVATGWKPLARSFWQSRASTELTLGANTCVISLASTSPGDGKMVLQRPSGLLLATTSAAYCTCADEHVVVHTDASSGAAAAGEGVQLLYQEARTVGGSEALAFLSPRPLSIFATDKCPVDALDAWLAAGHGVSPPSDEALPEAARATLHARGLSLAASAPAEAPFAVVAGVVDSCFVAVSAVEDDLALRISGGDRPLRVTHASDATTRAPARSLGWCTHVAQPVTVSHGGAGALVVYRVDSAKVAGTLGLREVFAEPSLAATFGALATWVPKAERGWDASAPLLTDRIPVADITVPRDERPVLHTRVVSLSMADAQVVPEPDELDRYVCAPSLDMHPDGALCVQSSPLSWRTRARAPGSLPGATAGAAAEAAGIAESPLPFWMDFMTLVEDRRGLEVELRLLTLARRLALQGYEATAREAVAEEREGVLVVGREGEDRIIAIGLLGSPPWVLPYTDTDAWTLADEPHSISIAAGEHRHLVTRPWVNAAAPEVRRTVVFRHRATGAPPR